MARGSRRFGRGIGLIGVALACLGLASVGHPGLRTMLAPAGTGLAGFYERLSRALETQLRTQALPAETRIVLGPGGRDIRLSGELAEGAARRLTRLLDDNPGIERIHLTSEGGLVDEGVAIGIAIAEHGLTAYVPDYCVSACTLAFVRGRERLIVRNARLGFHAPFEPGLFGQDFQADAAPERAAYVAAGVSPDFADAALNVPSGDLWIPPADRLLSAHVATGLVDTYRFPDSTLDGSADAAGARAAALRNLALLGPFETQAPGLVDTIAARYLESYRTGLSEGEGAERLRRMAARAVTRAVREADDATLAALGHHLLRAMGQAGEGDCAAIARGDLSLARDVLGASSEPAARTLLAQALARRSVPFSIPDRELNAGAAPADDATGPARTCAALRHAYRQALELPVRAAAASLRRLMPVAAPRPVLEATARP